MTFVLSIFFVLLVLFACISVGKGLKDALDLTGWIYAFMLIFGLCIGSPPIALVGAIAFLLFYIFLL